tara:strand:+ start:326 stop:514 length:189 start_codon:yes stop_codon:yes gene_type:complete
MKQEDRDLLIRIDERMGLLADHVSKQNGRISKLENNQNKMLGGVLFIAAIGTTFINWIKDKV